MPSQTHAERCRKVEILHSRACRLRELARTSAFEAVGGSLRRLAALLDRLAKTLRDKRD